MKKIIILFFTIITVLISSVSGVAVAESGAEDVAKSEIMMDYYSGQIIHEKNADQRLPIASMVKIMTALIAFERIDDGALALDQRVTVSETAAGMGGSQMFLESGDEYSISDLLKGIIVVSANDASVQIAETIAGSEAEFVKIMNDKAKSLGMNNTVFVNATGLPESGQYSTARDVAVMLKELSSHEKYYDYSKIWMENYEHPDGRITEFVNTNKLVRFNKDCEGGKTGYTSEAKFCLATTARRADTRLICVVIGADTSKMRFQRVSKLLNSGFSRFVNSKILSKEVKIDRQLNVIGGKKKSVSIAPERDVCIFREISGPANFDIEYEFNKNLRAPIKVGDVVGVARVKQGGVETKSVNLVAAENVAEKSYLDTVNEMLKGW